MSTRHSSQVWPPLWSLLWRSVVYFPLALVLFLLPLAIVGLGVHLTAWMVAYWLESNWILMIHFGAHLPLVFLAWYAYRRLDRLVQAHVMPRPPSAVIEVDIEKAARP